MGAIRVLPSLNNRVVFNSGLPVSAGRTATLYYLWSFKFLGHRTQNRRRLPEWMVRMDKTGLPYPWTPEGPGLVPVLRNSEFLAEAFKDAPKGFSRTSSLSHRRNPGAPLKRA